MNSSLEKKMDIKSENNQYYLNSLANDSKQQCEDPQKFWPCTAMRGETSVGTWYVSRLWADVAGDLQRSHGNKPGGLEWLAEVLHPSGKGRNRNYLIHQGLDNMTTILKRTFSNAFFQIMLSQSRLAEHSLSLLRARDRKQAQIPQLSNLLLSFVAVFRFLLRVVPLWFLAVSWKVWVLLSWCCDLSYGQFPDKKYGQ